MDGKVFMPKVTLSCDPPIDFSNLHLDNMQRIRHSIYGLCASLTPMCGLGSPVEIKVNFSPEGEPGNWEIEP